MRVAVLGTGSVGQALSARLDGLGHDVVIGTRDVEATRERPDMPPGLTVATFSAAAAHGELVVLATSGQVALEVLGAAGSENLAGKVVIDISNPLDFSAGFPPTLTVKDTDSLGEQIQAAFPDARVVKTLNTLTAELMIHPELVGDGRHTVFVSGNDARAKATVTNVLLGLGHTDVIDLGDITTCRGTEMYLPLWLRTMCALGTPMFNIKVVR